jgi:hypothetical protein
VTVESTSAQLSPTPQPAAARQRSGVGRSLLVPLLSIIAIALLAGGLVGFVYLAVATSDVVRTGTLNDPCSANLVAIGRAMLQYHNDNGRFPPAALLDGNGRPMHSWRVLLLPYLGLDSLYFRFNLSLPWDDPQNQLLSGQMPPIYHCPESFNVAGSETSYMVVTGPDTIFRGRESAAMHEIRDGASRTLLVVETTGGAINWLEPRDLTHDTLSLTLNGAATVSIGSQHKTGGAHVLLADGTVTFLSDLTSPDVVEALLTIDAADAPAE